MASAAARVFAIPELLEMILLCLPVRKADSHWKRDLHIYVLRRVNTAFNETIDRSGLTSHQLIQHRPSKPNEQRFDYWTMRWLVEENLWPDGYPEVRKGSGVYLSQQLHVWIFENDVTHTQRKILKPPGERCTRPEASWRKWPIHPTMEVQVVFSVALHDDTKRLTDDLQKCELNYAFYSGGAWPSLAVDDICDFMRMIRAFTAEQHIWFFLQATVQRLHRLKAHLAAYKEVDGVIKPGKRPAACPLCSRTKTSRVRCDICQHMERHVSRACRVGYRCQRTSCRYSNPLTIFWPLNGELFQQIGVVDEQGRAIINQ